LRSGGDGNQIEFFAEGADEDWTPEAIHGLFSLFMPVEPVLEGLSGVGLVGEGERDQCSSDGELIGCVQEFELQK
jgi:hypothetical protein